MIKNYLTLFLCIHLFASIGQTNDTLTRKQIRKNRPNYIILGTGINRAIFRDLATSPLFYKWIIPNFSLGYKKIDFKKEASFGINYSSGNHSHSIMNYGTTKLWSLNLDFYKLYQIEKLSTEKWNYKLGGTVQFTNNFRINEILENNAYGYEGFLNLLFSQKLTRDISRKIEKNKTIWFFNFHRKPRKRELSYQFNLGLINNYLRNGYAYLGQSEVINDFKLLDDYKFEIMKGYRANSVLNYTTYLKNNNALQFSYSWDVFSTGNNNKNNRFEMASHKIQFSLLFNLK